MKRINKLESLYDAALEIFARYGYKKTSVEDIASKIGVTKGNIYFYVKNKEDLYHQSVAYALRKWKLYVESGIKHEKDHKEKFKLLATLAVEYINNNDNLKSIIKNDPEIYTVNSSEDRFYEINMEAMNLLKNVLADGVSAGVFEVENIDYVSYLVFSVYIMYLIQSYAKPQNMSPELLFKEALTLILRGIIAK